MDAATRKHLVPSTEASGRFDPFAPLSPEARERHLERYLSFLEARNGAISLDTLSLSRREGYFEELVLEPLRWEGAIDRDGFAARLSGKAMSEVADPRVLWLVTIARANEGEHYGVALELRRFLRESRERSDPAQLYIFLEEQYHSRLLVEVCRTVGFEIDIQPPPASMRVMSRLIYYLPDRVRWPLVLCGEVLGTAVFRRLLDRCELFDAEPEVANRLRSLVSEIWIDEVLHVAFLRARLGPLALRAARALLPAVVSSLTSSVPELAELDCGGDVLLRELRAGVQVPSSLDWLEV